MKNYSLKYFYDPPLAIKFLFKDFIWNTSVRKVLLTFDDGPTPETTQVILRALEGFKVKSLFFCVGENVKNYPDLISEILSEGHEIGNHTYSHGIITRLSNLELKSQIDLFNRMLEDNHNYRVKYFRPPHGRFNFRTQKVMAEKKLKNVMWSLLTYDYRNDINLVNFAVKKYLNNNSIIVLHDSRRSKKIIVDSIKIIMEEVSKKGFEIGNPAECLK
ncbi:MAG: polysaccharide deacetylase family protein [Ignavibacteriaceae bacterium]